jgi:hercynylcysteine S-oxide lyase
MRRTVVVVSRPALIVGVCVQRIMGYMHDLAVRGGLLLAEAWGTELLVGEDMLGGMVNVRLPSQVCLCVRGVDACVCSSLSHITWGTQNYDDCAALPHNLLTYNNTWVPTFELQGHFYTRVSAQVYNELADFEMLSRAVLTWLS